MVYTNTELKFINKYETLIEEGVNRLKELTKLLKMEFGPLNRLEFLLVYLNFGVGGFMIENRPLRPSGKTSGAVVNTPIPDDGKQAYNVSLGYLMRIRKKYGVYEIYDYPPIANVEVRVDIDDDEDILEIKPLIRRGLYRKLVRFFGREFSSIYDDILDTLLAGVKW